MFLVAVPNGQEDHDWDGKEEEHSNACFLVTGRAAGCGVDKEVYGG